MTVFEQNNAIEAALPHKEMYAMYLRKSRADIELEALGEGETLAKHKIMLFNLAAKHDIYYNGYSTRFQDDSRKNFKIICENA